jgi:hypothetical protein
LTTRGSYNNRRAEQFVSSKLPQDDKGRGAEEEIEGLTREISELIRSADTRGRAELRDYAISLLQGETETTELAERKPGGGGGSGGVGFNPLALAIPFFLMGGFLLPVFPPVGVLLVLAALATAGWGVMWTLLFRKGRARGE